MNFTYCRIAFVLPLVLVYLSIPSNLAAEDKLIVASGRVVSQDIQSIRAPLHSLGWRNVIRYLASDGSRVEIGDVVVVFDARALLARKDELSDELADLKRQKSDYRDSLMRELAELYKRSQILEIEEATIARLVDIEEDLIGKNQSTVHNITASAIRSERDLLASLIASRQKEMDSGLGLFQRRIERTLYRIAEIDTSISKFRITAKLSGLIRIGRSRSGRLFSNGDVIVGGALILEIASQDRYVFFGEIMQRDAARILPGSTIEYVSDAVKLSDCFGKIIDVSPHIRRRSDRNPQRVMDFRASIDCPSSVEMDSLRQINGKVTTVYD